MPAFSQPSALDSDSVERLDPGWYTVLIVFLVALLYFLLFHRYGFFIQDEGTIAYEALRVRGGEVPYADFQTAYPSEFQTGG